MLFALLIATLSQAPDAGTEAVRGEFEALVPKRVVPVEPPPTASMEERVSDMEKVLLALDARQAKLATPTPALLEPAVASAIHSASIKNALGAPMVVSGGITTLAGLFIIASTPESRDDSTGQVLALSGAITCAVGAVFVAWASSDLDDVTRRPPEAVQKRAAEQPRPSSDFYEH